jgi:hypothetical protein
MNHNFADWEITELLPKKNPYKTDYFWRYFDDNNKNNKNFDKCFVTRFQHFYYIQDAWTWEDIRLYLEDKFYFININKTFHDSEPMYLWSITCELYTTFIYEKSTYEQARKEAIIYCLKLIK